MWAQLQDTVHVAQFLKRKGSHSGFKAGDVSLPARYLTTWHNLLYQPGASSLGKTSFTSQMPYHSAHWLYQPGALPLSTSWPLLHWPSQCKMAPSTHSPASQGVQLSCWKIWPITDSFSFQLFVPVYLHVWFWFINYGTFVLLFTFVGHDKWMARAVSRITDHVSPQTLKMHLILESPGLVIVKYHFAKDFSSWNIILLDKTNTSVIFF